MILIFLVDAAVKVINQVIVHDDALSLSLSLSLTTLSSRAHSFLSLFP
jgi:hypothetical protein